MNAVPQSSVPPFAVKICGITREEDARGAIEAGVDAIGLNFYAKSKRYIALEAAKRLVQKCSEPGMRRVLWTGVFVNASAEEIAKTASEVPLEVVQLHGDEPVAMVRELRLRLGQSIKIVRAVRVSLKSLAEVADYLAEARQAEALPDAVLVDAHASQEYGGTGKQLDWTSVQRDLPLLESMPLVLAGGLTPENVAIAISTSGARSVDTASGVEDSPGIKNLLKMQQFVARAKAALAG